MFDTQRQLFISFVLFEKTFLNAYAPFDDINYRSLHTVCLDCQSMTTTAFANHFFFQQSINYQQNINNIHPPVSVSQRLTLFSVPSDPATDIAILNQCIFAVDSRPQGPTVGEGRQVNLLNKELRNVKAADPTV